MTQNCQGDGVSDTSYYIRENKYEYKFMSVTPSP